jgi:hypothetical protein
MLAVALQRAGAMTCRIDTAEASTGLMVTIAGRVERAHVGELTRVCTAATAPVVIDLTHLVSADASAIDALKRLRDGGVQLVAVPSYLQFALNRRS